MQITRAVITAAGRGARQYPASDTVQKAMLPVVDRDGLTKPVLQIIAEEALESGIEEICVVSAPGDEAVYRNHFRNYAANLRSAFKGVEWAEEQARRLFDLEQRLHFSVQPEPQGYGHAVWCASEFAAGQPFLLLLGDHLYLSAEPRRCARQLIDLAMAEQCAVSAVQATREHLIHQYGTLTGRRLAERPDVYAIDEIVEKPNPTLAELRLQVPGLRVGHYLCFFGMHVLTPTVFDLLDPLVHDNVRELGQIQLTTALNALSAAGEIPGDRDPWLAIQPGNQVRRRRGADRPGDGRSRPRANSHGPGRDPDPARAELDAVSYCARVWVARRLRSLLIMTMASPGTTLIETITSAEPRCRDRSARSLIRGVSLAEKLQACEELEAFRQRSENLYERVRACLFLQALYRYEVQEDPSIRPTGLVPFHGFMDMMGRRYEQAITAFRQALKDRGPNGAVCSALAQAYDQIAFQTLADQVRRSVRSCPGNRWMFRVGGIDEHPLHIHPRLLERGSEEGLYPILIERTPVRLDLSHSAWSDIFFLGMDYPEGARVLNISVDLGVHGRDLRPIPPIECRVRVIARPLLRLTSIDLNSCKDVESLDELFNFGNDYLGLVKAGVIASGLVPPSLEGTTIKLEDLLGRVVRPGHGLEVVSKVNDIPKGSRLAVSTNLLASLISMLMRATGQTRNLTGPLDLDEARVVVARAILGEWLGGSGGGWQDSGGIFPGIKLIHGVAAADTDPEWGVSRGRLLPAHRLLDGSAARPATVDPATGPASAIPQSFEDQLAASLVLVHGGMAQNVGPILNMVTTKYLLRSHGEWLARQQRCGFSMGCLPPSMRLTSAPWAAVPPRTGTARSRRSFPGSPMPSPRPSSAQRGRAWATTSGGFSCSVGCRGEGWPSSLLPIATASFKS